MKTRNIRAALTAVLTVALAAGTFMMTGCGKSYEHTFGELQWYSTYKNDPSDAELKTISDTYYYSDDWFADSPEKENPELALASMQLTASAVTDEPGGPGETFLKSMGFEEVGYSDFASADPDDCNYTWARKKAGDNTIIAVAIQSASNDPAIKNKGWKQNFTVNDPAEAEPAGEHYAYAKAVDKVADDIAALADTDKVSYWITGESRGGAIANVLAAKLPDKLDGKDAKIFAYTFESPATVDADSASASACKYIHNYVCSDDIVTLIPVWGMTRYGVTHDLKTKDTDSGLVDELAKLGKLVFVGCQVIDLNRQFINGLFQFLIFLAK